MASATRTIRVRFDGSATGLQRAARAGERAIDRFERKVEKSVVFDAAEGFVESISKSLKGLGGHETLIQAAVAAGIALAPAIGAAISGAVIGAVGVGGLIGGIAAASHDPKLRAAASEFGRTISGEFFSGGQAFVEPTIEGLHILQDAFARLNLGDSWARVAPEVTEIAQGIAGLAERFMPGFNRALDASRPALHILASELPEIGDALSDMLIDISESKGTLEGWVALLKGTESTIRVTGEALGFLGGQFHDSLKVWEEMTGGLTDLGVDLPVLGALHRRLHDLADTNDAVGHMAVRATTSLVGEGNAAKATADAMKKLTEQMSDYLGIQMGVDQANQHVAEGMLNLRKALKENGKDWSTNTEAGLANRAALMAQVQALIQQRQANIDAKVPIEEVNARFEAQLHVLEQLAIKAGISKQALQDLIGDYYVNIRFTASTGTDSYTRALARALSGRDFPSGFAIGGYGRGLVMTGERGRELVDLGSGGRVYNHGDTEKMLAGGGDTVIENHIYVGEEVVRVVRTVVGETNRLVKRRVLAGAGAR